VVLMYVRFPLSLRNVEDLLLERGIDLWHATVRFGWTKFGPLFADDIRCQRVSRMRGFRHWRWHPDEMYVRVTAKWCTVAVDQEGEVLESCITRTRDKAAALTLEAGNIYATHRRIWRQVSVRPTAPSGVLLNGD